MHVAVAKVLHAQGLQIICPSKTNCMRVAAKLQSVSVPTATQNQEPAKEGRRRNAGGEGDFEAGNQFPARDPSVPGTGPPGGFVSFVPWIAPPKLRETSGRWTLPLLCFLATFSLLAVFIS